ncbi:DUF1631 domain-containing protein [Lysobacter sp. OAE881]|uniref:DUF1631 domain-containing protein n=1 Tax=Lysobacter sp. OAE881 TaxID=2663813 RepID=UPI00178A89A6
MRRVLEHLYALVSDEMSRQLEAMLGEFEQQLFKHADLARNPAQQASHLETLRTTRLNRADLVPRYLALVESELTTIRDPIGAPLESNGSAPAFRDLKLVEHGEVDESLLLRTIAARQESRAGLPLLLLGQRFGVLAGQPAFDAERLPVGPYALGKILSDAAHALQISPEARLHLYKVFDHQVMTGYAQLVETMNALLARENVLPSLSFVPIRPRSPQRQEGQRRVAEPGEAVDAPQRQRPMTDWPGNHDGGNGPALESETFNLLQQLLAARRDAMNRLRPGTGGSDAGAPRPTLTREELANALSALQDVPLHQAPPRNLTDVRQTLLAQARQQRGEATFLSRDDADTFELLDLFYNEIGRELRSDAAVGTLLNRLQVPLVRLALQDRGFFVRNEHPARQLLNAVAEAGAHWVPRDEADPQLNDQLRRAVDHVVENYDGDNGVFENANRQLQEHLRAMARKAEVAERRHVEAARGKEKLVLAKRQASDAIEAIISEHKLPRFVQTLLSQAWTDVLTLTLLRSGEDSEEWQRQLDATREIVAANAAGQLGQVSSALGEDIEAALTQVGYHVEDAGAISRQLVTGTVAANDDAASRTELALKLKARTRLGTDDVPAPKAAERTPKEQECWRHLRTLPFGTWFEFDIGDAGEVVRRRLSWFSPVTDNALFVNQRGQRVAEQSLDSLARQVAAGRARVVTEEKSRLVDRAWSAVMGALGQLVGHNNHSEAHA